MARSEKKKSTKKKDASPNDAAKTSSTKTADAAAGTPDPAVATDAGTPFSDALRVGEGFVLADVAPRSTPAFDGGKAEGKAALGEVDDELDALQEMLFASSTAGDRRRVLLVVQGMDTAGKGGIMRHVVGAVDPQGVQIKAFKKPTEEELSHPFLWRIRQAVPDPGMIGVFDRSHYEDVLVVRVHDLVPPAQWGRRYSTINDFEKSLVDDGVTLIKVMLHISPEEQKERLGERLERPDKYWKYNPGDLDERAHWDAYQEAYQVALERCSTQVAPWFVVPADRKWYARLAVQRLLLEHLRALELRWPPADFDVEAEQERLAAG
ncbi:polyphosphate kinase 2 family protein [Ornithinimicrobium sp. W1679]|uniref:polyphosphate kinase 2 family protein n=1 Tax=Ornithinimicrobium sp. W1679 TaxID=3418770 RepID=UPI003CFBC069